MSKNLRFKSAVSIGLIALVFLAGCSTMPNPAKRLANKLGSKAREVQLRDKVEKDKFPTAKEAGLD